MKRRRFLLAVAVLVLAGCGEQTGSGGGSPASAARQQPDAVVTPEDVQVVPGSSQEAQSAFLQRVREELSGTSAASVGDESLLNFGRWVCISVVAGLPTGDLAGKAGDFAVPDAAADAVVQAAASDLCLMNRD